MDVNNKLITDVNEDTSFYYHIPFCSFLCHYCDFVKTANFNHEVTKKYFEILSLQTKKWFELSSFYHKIPSIFFGGGTPGLFSKEYSSLLDKLNKYTTKDCEICLEVNPNNINTSMLEEWKDLGFNRLSIGVQTFNDIGLKILTRDHDSSQAIKSIELTSKYFENISIDLIYGWPNQTIADFEQDLTVISKLNPVHISLYNLTFEDNTPYSKMKKRGVIIPLLEEQEYELYKLACQNLADLGYIHYEVSNWSKPNYESKHNKRYWQMKSYIGVGAGAHGFITDSYIGNRYGYTAKIDEFLNLSSDIKINEDKRKLESWIIEYLYTGLRTADGVDIEVLKAKISNSDLLKYFLDSYFIIANNKIKLNENEWFRHNYHVSQVLQRML